MSEEQKEFDESLLAIIDGVGLNGYLIMRKQLQLDEGYGWSWHCNFAMAMYDCGVEHELANNIAADIMEKFFDVNTRILPEFQDLEKIWKSNSVSDRVLQFFDDKVEENCNQNQVQRSKIELGVIRSIQFGLADRDEPCILMVVNTLSGESMLLFEGPDIATFVKQADVSNINNLVGETCVVSIEDHIMKFVEMFR